MRLLEDLTARLRHALAGRPAVPEPAPVSAPRAQPPIGTHARPVRGWVQPDRRSCGAACLVVSRALGDPSYAAWLETGEVAGRPRDRRTPGRRFADEVLATHVRTNRWIDALGRPQWAWPRGLGTPPWSLARELTATGGTSPPGTGHRVLTVSPRRHGEAYDVVTRAVAHGHAVPLYVGTRLLPRHVVLVVGGDAAALEAYDPSSGRTVRLPREDFVRGHLEVAGWSEPWFAVLARGGATPGADWRP
ncbi:hypothetical protein GCM10011376_04390 [Nocardioides flavus (ex Wang et al. 2016)]|uniref:Peptidase_C39 like family protein n=1 Tax=Nocardioides flavus (ex Wang et al. 2016) TaxID=2058780 RepID=A0ABQ3HI69_9ACTN|nr:hypothetical protein [Nocardioides flavus (ex Wang et al. 2016)]GHE15570.1 hypothetical protein GCM10011376_04390 [Nocardioides flavus (ex Wang et al. 2016)]